MKLINYHRLTINNESYEENLLPFQSWANEPKG